MVVKKSELKLDIKFYDSSDRETIRGGTIFNGGYYRLEKEFDRGHYSRGTGSF